MNGINKQCKIMKDDKVFLIISIFNVVFYSFISYLFFLFSVCNYSLQYFILFHILTLLFYFLFYFFMPLCPVLRLYVFCNLSVSCFILVFI